MMAKPIDLAALARDAMIQRGLEPDILPAWVRAFDPPVEGKLVRGAQGLDVGERVSVRLTRTDVARGFIDFEALS